MLKIISKVFKNRFRFEGENKAMEPLFCMEASSLHSFNINKLLPLYPFDLSFIIYLFIPPLLFFS
jgi:hypothetical protein